jgi:hypothetical protein
MTDKHNVQSPVAYVVAKWYGYILSWMFLLYGGVMLVLGFLDRNYQNFGTFLVFLLLGGALLSVCIGYRDKQVWGWYGLLVINCLVVVGTLFGLGNYLNLIILVASLAALGALLHPQGRVSHA